MIERENEIIKKRQKKKENKTIIKREKSILPSY